MGTADRAGRFCDRRTGVNRSISLRPAPKVVGFKAIYTSEEENEKCFPFTERERNGYVRIGIKDFVKYISNRTGLDFKNSTRYIGVWDEEQKLLTINLKEPMDQLKEIEEE